MRYLIATLLLVLASCSNLAPVAPVAASLTPVVLTPEQIATMQTMCQAAKPALDIAALPSMPAQVKETAVFPQAYCGQLLAGAVPATTDGHTTEWLPEVINATKVAAQIAGVVLPLIL